MINWSELCPTQASNVSFLREYWQKQTLSIHPFLCFDTFILAQSLSLTAYTHNLSFSPHRHLSFTKYTHIFHHTDISLTSSTSLRHFSFLFYLTQTSLLPLLPHTDVSFSSSTPIRHLFLSPFHHCLQLLNEGQRNAPTKNWTPVFKQVYCSKCIKDTYSAKHYSEMKIPTVMIWKIHMNILLTEVFFFF